MRPCPCGIKNVSICPICQVTDTKDFDERFDEYAKEMGFDPEKIKDYYTS